jgi:hypothetical protein
MNRGLAPDSALALPGSAAAAVAWRAQGTLHVTVIVKATFAFASDAPMRRTEPQPILRAEVHHDNSVARSVRFTTDLAPALARADVLFTGSAYAPHVPHVPHGAPVRSMPVRLAIFAGGRPILDKRLLVQDPGGLTRMPVVYERTGLGANATENPFGLLSTDGVASIVDPARPERPAGFGPIGRSWPVRRRLLGDTPRQVLEGPVAEIPDGFVWAYFQAAPLDQQTEDLRGDEWIILEGLHPSQPLFRTCLPGAQGAARIHGLAAFGVPEGQGLQLYADTLRIEGDEQRCTVVCRGSFPIAGEDALAAVRIVAGVAVGGEALPWFEPPRVHPGAHAQAVQHGAPPAFGTAASGRDTIALSPEADEEARRRSALGFRPGPAAPQWPPPAPAQALSTGTLAIGAIDAASLRALPFPEAAAGRPAAQTLYDEATSLGPDAPVAWAPALPFQPPAQASLAAQERADRREIPAPPPTGTLALGMLGMEGIAPRADVLPFVPPRAPEPAPPPPPSEREPSTPPPASERKPSAPPPASERDLPTLPPPRAIPAPETAPEPAGAGPWAPAPPTPAAPAPQPPAPAPTPPAASTTWKKGLYGRFGVKR